MDNAAEIDGDHNKQMALRRVKEAKKQILRTAQQEMPISEELWQEVATLASAAKGLEEIEVDREQKKRKRTDDRRISEERILRARLDEMQRGRLLTQAAAAAAAKKAADQKKALKKEANKLAE